MLMLSAPYLPFIATGREDCRRNDKRGLIRTRNVCLSAGLALADLEKHDVLTPMEAGEDINQGHLE